VVVHLCQNEGPTIPIGRIVEKRVCGIFGLVIAAGFKPLILSQYSLNIIIKNNKRMLGVLVHKN